MSDACGYGCSEWTGKCLRDAPTGGTSCSSCHNKCSNGSYRKKCKASCSDGCERRLESIAPQPAPIDDQHGLLV